MSRIGRSVLEPWEQESALTMQGALEGGEASVFFFFFFLAFTLSGSENCKGPGGALVQRAVPNLGLDSYSVGVGCKGPVVVTRGSRTCLPTATAAAIGWRGC